MSVVEYDAKQLEKLVRGLHSLQNGAALACSRAINKTLTATRKEVATNIRDDYDIKVGAIKKNFAVEKANLRKLEGRLTAQGSPGIPLKEYARTSNVPSTRRLKSGGYRPKVGIPVLIRKDRGKLSARGVFLARMKSGHIGAFKRPGTGKKIDRVYGPSAARILASGRYSKNIYTLAEETLSKNMRQQTELLLKKLGK